MTPIRLGDLLIRAAVVNEAQLNAALAEQQKWGGRLGTILVRMGALSEDLLVKALSRQLNIPRAAIGANDPLTVPEAILARVERAVCERTVMVPIAYVHERRSVQVAVADPFNVVAIDDFGRRLGLRVETLLAGETQIQQAIGRIYAGAPDVKRAEAGFGFTDNAGRALGTGSGPVPVSPPPQQWSQPPTQAPPWSPPPPPSPPWSPPPTSTAPTAPPGWSTSWSPPPNSGSGPVRTPQPGDDLRVLADQQRKAVRALVELLVEKGVISHAELKGWLGR